VLGSIQKEDTGVILDAYASIPITYSNQFG